MKGWIVTCPDGKVRHYPHFNFGDAECDAGVFDRDPSRCSPEKVGEDHGQGPCPGGKHTVDPIVFDPPKPSLNN
jgi:hypothetical protein